MKRRASVMVLLAMVILLPVSHLEIRASDDSWLMLVDGRPVDVAGHIAERYTAWRSDCRPVQDVPANSPTHASALQAIRQHSTPDSLSAQILRLTRQGDWLLAQVRFEQLQEAVLVLQERPQGAAIADSGVWSGSTHPHRPAPVIRRYLQSRVPQLPTSLIDCFVPEPGALPG